LEAVRLVLEQDWSQSQAARRVQAGQQSVSRWVGEYRARGAAGLRQAERAGRKPLLDAVQLERLVSLLLQGPEAHGFSTPLWSCPRVARLIADEFGVDYHEGHVWKILRALNWSPQRPVGKARERNEEAIRTGQRKTWPAIKKKLKRKAARSSSSTKADGVRSRIVAAPGRPAARRPCCSSTSTGTSFPCPRG